MHLVKNIISELFHRTGSLSDSIKPALLLSLFLLYSPSSHAADCQFNDLDKRAKCLDTLVTELKQDLKTLIGKVKADKAATDNILKENKKTQEQLKVVVANKDKIINKQKEIIAAQNKDRELANKQVSKLKLCCLGNPNNAFRFNLGIGATSNNSDVEAAGLIGVGIGRINVHGFLQSDNSGLILGYEF